MLIERCNDCRWWAPIDRLVTREGVQIGDCRQRPPMLVQAEDGKRHACHPRTVETHFCGKFRERHERPVEVEAATDA